MRRFAPFLLLLPLPLAAQPTLARRVDSLFASFTTATPGCAAGVARRGEVLLTKGWGMANLEYGIPLGAGSILESGSVAKQFTAAALALLQLDGTLSLDDDIHRWLPEVPAFGGQRITIRHLLTHTSGLRDQWGLLSLTGNPPTRQVHTLPLILDLVRRQQDLNFPVGSEYLYSNTGYALAAMIVQRASGQSLAEFTRRRLFEPMGMTHTSWRDDFQRIVPGRATAYEHRADGSYAQLMPFTNVYGNGGLLTTVGDMLTWNEALTRGTIPGGRPLVDLLETRQRLTGGQTIAYALGLMHGSWEGHRIGAHSGSTAGYSTYLVRFPDYGLSIAVFCNVADGAPTPLAFGIAQRVLGVTLSPPPAAPDAATASAVAGRYRNPATDDFTEVVVRPQGVLARSPAGSGLLAFTGRTARLATGATFEFSGAPGAREVAITDADGVRTTWREVVAPNAMTLRLEDYAGTYESPELRVRYEVRVDGNRLLLRFPPAPDQSLAPIYPDGFEAEEGTLRFVRDAQGRVTEFQVFAGRVRHVRFLRTGTP